MLAADKLVLERNLKLQSLRIREKELEFFTTSLSSYGTLSALQASFVFGGIAYVRIPLNPQPVLHALYFLFCFLCLWFHILNIFVSTLVAIMGPGLALRGPDGSVHRAVDGLMLEQRIVLMIFCLGLFFFINSYFFFIWMRLEIITSIIISIVLFSMEMWLFRFAKNIHKRFKIQKGEKVSGELFLGGFNPELDGNEPNFQDLQPLSRWDRFLVWCGMPDPRLPFHTQYSYDVKNENVDSDPTPTNSCSSRCYRSCTSIPIIGPCFKVVCCATTTLPTKTSAVVARDAPKESNPVAFQDRVARDRQIAAFRLQGGLDSEPNSRVHFADVLPVRKRNSLPEVHIESIHFDAEGLHS